MSVSFVCSLGALVIAIVIGAATILVFVETIGFLVVVIAAARLDTAIATFYVVLFKCASTELYWLCCAIAADKADQVDVNV